MFKFPTWRPQTFVLVLACHANPETSNKWRTISPCHCKFERVALWGSSETFGQLRELGNWAIRCFLGLRALGTSNLEVTMLFLNLFSMKSDLIQGIWMCSGGRKCLRRVFFNFTHSIDHAWGCHPANTKSRRQRSGKVFMAFHCHFQISWKVTGQICGLRLFHLLRLLARTLQESIEWMSKRYQTVAWITVYRYRAAS